MKAPTKKEALEGIRRHVYAGELRFKFFEDALDLIETMGVPFSPERVAPHRGDLLTEATELVDDMIVRTSDGYAYTYRDSHDMWFGMTNNFTMPTEYLIGRESVIRDVPGESDAEPDPFVADLSKAWSRVMSHPAFNDVDCAVGGYLDAASAMCDRLTDLVLFEQADHSGHSHAEPELAAERRDDGTVWVGGLNLGSASLSSATYRVSAARYAAVARLREQEEREAGGQS